MPVPKSCSHNLFTNVLETNGLRLSVIHSAIPMRFGFVKLKELLRTFGMPGETTSPLTFQFPRMKTWVFLTFSTLLSIIIGVFGGFFLNKSQYKLSIDFLDGSPSFPGKA